MQDRVAWLGVNSELAAVIDLPAGGVAADVGVAAGIYVDQSLPGRLTPFRDFTVRSLSPGALAAPQEQGSTQADVDRFLGLLAATEEVTPLVGPLSGRLVESSSNTVPMAAAGVSFADFAATVTLVNPSDDTPDMWDSGFQFRSDDIVTNRIVVDSLGDVYVTRDGGDPVFVGYASAYRFDPGDTNTLQLFVEASRALIGVNGEFVAAIGVPSGSVAGDVLVGTAFFTEDFVDRRVTEYQQFRVWGIK